MPRDFKKTLERKPVVFDGATGTMLQRLGMKPGGSPDELNLTAPEMVTEVHRAYRKAGADVATTNTFGANRVKLAEYGLGEKVGEINAAGVKCARKAVGERGLVAGDIGPTGRFVEPVGDMGFDEAIEIFTEQAAALKKAGADLIIIETMMDIKEMRAAIIASKKTGLPVVATMTFDQSMRSVLGTTPEAFAIVADSLGADCVGANCSLGVEGIFKAVSAMRKVTALPLIAQPNAGLPVLKGTETVFPATPEEMADYVPHFVAVGVRVLGGCCGTTPEHMEMMGGAFRALKPDTKPENPTCTTLASRTGFITFGPGLPPVVIGERINPTGRKKLAAEIKEGKTAIIRNETREQAEAGAHALDVNVGVPGVDEPAAMKRAVFAVNDNSALPVVIDSADPEALLAGLKAVDGKPLINSVSGEEKKLRTVLPLAKEYGAAVLGLTLDDKGIPETAEERLRIAEKILERALKLGIRKEDLVIDCLAMAVSAMPGAARETLRAIRLVREELGLSTVLGVSNISFGLPSRETVSSNFFSMALASGLTSAIINPKNERMMDAYHASLVLLDLDRRAEGYVKRFQAAGGAEDKTPEKKPTGLKERLARAVIDGDEENVVGLVEEALKKGWDPVRVSNDGLLPGLEEVGKLFASNRYFLPQVILSADTMKKAFGRLKKELKGKKGHSLGKVVMATVEGDIHDIGKNIVCTLLENHGFEVTDLGKNVPAKKIVDAARDGKADIVGLSALMTTTVTEMGNVIKKLKADGVDVKTVVGGAVVTPEFAGKIGADEYGGEATEAVEKMKRLV
ncbi:MAG: homocysteine S-methyltransferase family protein, partial [Thermodesulfobacteriota bacterium]